MGQIKPGRYEQNGVGFDVRERGELTLVEITGEEFTFNANGFYVAPLNPDEDTPEATEAVEKPKVESEKILRGYGNRGSKH